VCSMARVAGRLLLGGSFQSCKQRQQVLVRAHHIHTSSTALARHYDVLQLTQEATYAEIKAAYLNIAQQYHPDRNKKDGAALMFQAASEAHEVLKDDATRRLYDSTLFTRAAGQGFGSGTARAAKRRPDTIIEAELRVAVASGNVDGAVQTWVTSGSSLKLLLFLIELFQRHETIPSSLPDLLGSLHASEPTLQQQASGGSANQVPLSTERAVSAFIERKTLAYNELIRLCHICKQKEQLFGVLDEMEANKIDVDMGTWAVLEDAFSWKS
jgi:hypothetical protein